MPPRGLFWIPNVYIILQGIAILQYFGPKSPDLVYKPRDRRAEQQEEGGIMNLPKHLLPTTVVGSYPQPEWLVDRAVEIGAAHPYAGDVAAAAGASGGSAG